ncbi:MAG: cyclodeaminase/cyclohydrolase family protein [Oscillospiraceae bacterium]|nr:cyclodeaminase/cyclohydrolase family protein [Oscillospiraceae bacterium]
MSDNLSSLCIEFTNRLASSAPVPGGGGAAALCGALSCALCSMAGELSIGKKSTLPNSAELEGITAAAKTHAARFLELIDADADAFEPLSRAYSIPKDDVSRAAVLSEASLAACSAPYDILKECVAVSALLKRIAEICSRIMISDVGCAASICCAAAECAAMNVYVNLPAVKDADKALKLKSETEEMLRRCTMELEATANAVLNTLKEF